MANIKETGEYKSQYKLQTFRKTGNKTDLCSLLTIPNPRTEHIAVNSSNLETEYSVTLRLLKILNVKCKTKLEFSEPKPFITEVLKR